MNIKNDDMVKVTDMNTVVELKLTSTTKTPKGKIRRIDKTQYVDIDTGEVKTYKSKNTKTSSRKNNPNSLARTGRNAKEMMICNFVDKKQTQYITLTYKEAMYDYKQATNDFKAFVKKIRRTYCKDNKMQYFFIQEQHYNDSLHFHCLFYWDKEYPSDMVKNLSTLWEKGTSIHKPIKENKDILYIATYLVSGHFAKDKKANKNDFAQSSDDKGAIKNVRLDNLPAYYRDIKHSKNMLKPIKDEMLYSDVKDIYGFAEPFTERSFEKTLNGFTVKNEYEYYAV